MSFQQFVVAGVLSFLYVKFGGLSFTIPTWTSLWATLYLGVFATLVCLTVQVWAQQYLPPFKASLIFTIEPVIAAFIAWRWLGETFRFAQAIGACLIVLAMIVAVLPVRRVADR
jgi:drug/metabolite transporter (DMT)-like permease